MKCRRCDVEMKSGSALLPKKDEKMKKSDAIEYLIAFIIAIVLFDIGFWAVRSFLFAEFAPIFDGTGRVTIFLSFLLALRGLGKVVNDDGK